MELSNIEKLLEKYFEGQTTRSEEEVLKAYFKKGDIPQYLEKHRDLFQFVSNEHQMVASSEAIRYTSGNMCMGIAASIVLMIGLFLTLMLTDADRSELETSKDPEIVWQQTKEVLHMVAK